MPLYSAASCNVLNIASPLNASISMLVAARGSGIFTFSLTTDVFYIFRLWKYCSKNVLGTTGLYGVCFTGNPSHAAFPSKYW